MIHRIGKSNGNQRQEGAAAREERSGGSPSGRTRNAAPKATTPIVAMSHLDFLEKIAEGFVIEAYNSTKKNEIIVIPIELVSAAVENDCHITIRTRCKVSTAVQCQQSSRKGSVACCLIARVAGC